MIQEKTWRQRYLKEAQNQKLKIEKYSRIYQLQFRNTKKFLKILMKNQVGKKDNKKSPIEGFSYCIGKIEDFCVYNKELIHTN